MSTFIKLNILKPADAGFFYPAHPYVNKDLKFRNLAILSGIDLNHLE